MNILNIIEKKSEKKSLTEQEINFWVQGYTNGEIPDYQISSLLMAIRINGMDEDETYYLTKAYIESGDVVDFGDMFVVDKHSTGGIGDKTSIVLSPLMASVGLNVGKLSGRGLGFTGGTVDKLESIEGFSTSLKKEKFISNIKDHGIALIGQIANLTPADKVIYSLRDVTATVNSMPLIAASIMSKKLANGADMIMLDVKCGAGAFMKNIEEAQILSRTLINISERFNRKTICIITDMSNPLGNTIGNAIEVEEAVETLKGNGPSDLNELCLTFASYALSHKNNISVEKAKEQLLESISSGNAYNKLLEWVKLQSGKTDKIEDGTLFNNKKMFEIKASKNGFVNIKDASELGMIGVFLGGGRMKKTDLIDFQVGIQLLKKQGDKVDSGETIAKIFYKEGTDLKEIESYFFEKAVEVQKDQVAPKPLILEIVE